MRCRVKKWGNSYAIRLPKTIVEEYDLKESTLELEQRPEALVLKKESKKDALKRLLKDTTPQEEVEWGDEYDKEFW